MKKVLKFLAGFSIMFAIFLSPMYFNGHLAGDIDTNIILYIITGFTLSVIMGGLSVDLEV